LHFLNKATNKKVIQLETAISQIKLFSGLSIKQQIEFLEHSLADKTNLDKEIKKIVTYWKNGDTINLDKMLSAAYKENPTYKDIYKKFYSDRNITMTKKIEIFLSTKNTYFVVIGAAHTVGELGIVKILKSKNKYKITQP
jgi:uncharacterized protein